MIGVVIVSHGNIAKEFLSVAENILGAQEKLLTVCMDIGDDIEKRREEIMLAVRSVDSGSGVVILTDMFGGAPSNLAISVLDGGMKEVLAGLNLPMLIKLLSVRKMLPFANAVEQAHDAGHKYLGTSSAILGEAS